MPKFYPEPPRNPALVPIKERIAIVGGWSDRALFPSAKVRKARQPRKVFIIRRETRHFAVVAATLAEAEQRIDALYP